MHFYIFEIHFFKCIAIIYIFKIIGQLFFGLKGSSFFYLNFCVYGYRLGLHVYQVTP